MQTDNSRQSPQKGTLTATDYLRFKAKKLLNCARSDAKSSSLPVLRRLISSKVFRTVKLSDLFQHRQHIQRKHLLQLLALEAGFSDWAALKANYKELSADRLPKDSSRLFEIGYPNLWFPSHREAADYIAEFGGELIPQGEQAVVVPHSLKEIEGLK